MKLLNLSLFLSLLTSPLISNAAAWSEAITSKAEENAFAIVQNRTVTKQNRWQIAGPSIGTSGRGDFYTNYFAALGLRYHFNETHGWEIGRALWNSSSPNSTAIDVEARTGLRPDSQISELSLSTSYVFTPIYGKYAWNERSLVHFDMYALVGAGMRFARDHQIFAETGLGMNHYLSARFSLAPEVRVRLYQEDRSTSVFVAEVFASLGAAWLF